MLQMCFISLTKKLTALIDLLLNQTAYRLRPKFKMSVRLDTAIECRSFYPCLCTMNNSKLNKNETRLYFVFTVEQNMRKKMLNKL